MSCRVAVFACSTLALSGIQYLSARSGLSCVVLPAQSDPQSVQLEQHLQHIQLPYFRLGSVNMDANLALLRQSRANLAVTLTFNEILPAVILDFFDFGIFNFHASDLPKYRGPVPLFWQLKHREPESAVTVHCMTAQLDAGDIVMQEKFAIEPYDTFGLLCGKFVQAVPVLLERLIDLVAAHGRAVPARAQVGAKSYQSRPDEADLRVDWKSMSGEQIVALARACNPVYVGARLAYQQSPLFLLEAQVAAHSNFGVKPGTVIHVGEPEGLIVATRDGSLRLNVLSAMDGVFSGLVFAEHFRVDVGDELSVSQ